MNQENDAEITRITEADSLIGETQSLKNTIIPNDWFKLTYVILFVHGIGHLLPWNMFITAHEYFEDRFSCPDNPSNHSSSCYGFQHSFENYFSLSSTLSAVTACAINIQSKISFKYRIFVSLMATLVLFSLTTILVYFSSDKWVDGYFALTILTIIVLSLFSGFLQSSTFGLAGMLPESYTTAVFSGQGCAGLFSSITRIISTVAVKNNDITLSALIYFLSAVLVIFICLVTFFVLLRLKFVRYHLLLVDIKALKEKEELAVINTSIVKETKSIPFLFILSKVYIYGLSVLLSFTVSVGLFPAVISNIESTVSEPQASIWTGSLFDALVCFLLISCSDFAGRCVSNWFIMSGKWQYVLFISTLLRFLFVPLILLCNVQPRSDHFPVLLMADYWPVILTMLLGLTGGLTASLAMVSAPRCVEPQYRETASVIMTWFLSLGPPTGAGLSFLFNYLIRI